MAARQVLSKGNCKPENTCFEPLGIGFHAARALLALLSPDNNTISPNMNTHTPEAKPGSASKTSKSQHIQEEETRDPRKALPLEEIPEPTLSDEPKAEDLNEEIPEPILSDEPKAEDLTSLHVDREWIVRLRAACTGFGACGGSAR